jgi:hypothetical protein
MLPSVPNGAIVTYVGTWPPGTYLGFVDYTSAVFADLTAAGLVILQNSGGPALALLTGTSFSITLEIQVENGLGFASGDDLIAIIRNAVYQESGNFPISDSMPYIQAPGAASTATGQPGTSAPATPACGDPSLTFASNPAAWFSCLTSKGLSTLGLVAIGIAVGAVLLFTAQKKRQAGI